MRHHTLCLVITILCILFAPLTTLTAGAFVEIGTGYNIPLGAWRHVYGAGMAYGGMFGFTFGEILNPGVSAWFIFPSAGSIITQEYEQRHNTTYISLFAMTNLFSINNRAYINLSDKNTLTFDMGYGIFSQRNYATIENNSYETVDNLSGHGLLFGLGLQRMIGFSIFDFIHPYFKCYYAPNEVTYHIVGPGGTSIDDYTGAQSRMGFVAGVTLISIGEE